MASGIERGIEADGIRIPGYACGWRCPLHAGFPSGSLVSCLGSWIPQGTGCIHRSRLWLGYPGFHPDSALIPAATPSGMRCGGSCSRNQDAIRYASMDPVLDGRSPISVIVIRCAVFGYRRDRGGVLKLLLPLLPALPDGTELDLHQILGLRLVLP